MSKKQPIVAEVKEVGSSLISRLNQMQSNIQEMQSTLKSKESGLKQRIAQQKRELDEQRQLEAARLIQMAEEEKASRKEAARESADANNAVQNDPVKKIADDAEKKSEPVKGDDTVSESKSSAQVIEKAKEPEEHKVYEKRFDTNSDKNVQKGQRLDRKPQDRGQSGQQGGFQRGDRQQNQRPYGDRPQRDFKKPMGDRDKVTNDGFKRQGDRTQGGAFQKDRNSRPQGDRPQRSQNYSKPSAPIFDAPIEKERVSNYDPNKKLYRNNRDNEKKVLNKKEIARQQNNRFGDDDVWRGKKKKKESVQSKMEPIKIEHAIMTAEEISIKDLSEKLGKPAADIIKKLFMLGIMATINNDIDYETAALVATDYGIDLELKVAKSFEETMTDADEETEGDNNEERAPIVTIMGHVDHGKTSLLDAIRKTNVTAHEAGGITQHIGAYTVEHNKKKITFLDTPGHEAFTSMRARGAQVTDIAILVVAADDGVMPQTIEAINHAQAAEVPIIVAINKMDKPSANPDRVKQELTNNGIVPEEWGGDAILVPVSALTGDGIDNLLEMVLLVADVNQYKANSAKKARGVIIEAKLDKGRGPVATVLIQNGTLKIGDTIVAGTAFGHVRAMIDDKGRRVSSAGPSMPVEVLGFNDVPDAGDKLYVTEDEKLSRLVAQERKDKIKAEQIKARSKASLDDLFNQIEEGSMKDLNLIVKADVQGSVEAVKQALEKLSNEKVRVKVIHGAVGAIKESDVILAAASNAIIIGFNVRPDSMASAAAEREEVDMRMYRVIYTAIEDIEAAMNGMLDPEFKEVVIGHAEIRNTFKVPGVGTIAGSYVTDGSIQRNAGIRLLRDNIVIHEGKISSLKRFKDDVKEVNSGYECGVGIENYNDIKEGDVFEAFIMEQIKN